MRQILNFQMSDFSDNKKARHNWSGVTVWNEKKAPKPDASRNDNEQNENLSRRRLFEKLKQDCRKADSPDNDAVPVSANERG